ncbi:MAG TPA: phosphoribosylglycinamide formyltransferase [Drouetiella sp.]
MSLQLIIFVSGRGSNMEAILKSIKSGELDASIELVFSNDPNARALETAKEYGIKTASLASAGMTRSEHENKVREILQGVSFDYIVLAGYMRILTSKFLAHFRDPRGFFRVINIHPSILPAFPGKCAYEDAFNYGVKLSGITVHLVDEQVDHGAILAQQSFPRLEDDTLETFKARGLAVEHALYPAVLREISNNGINVKNLTRESIEK